jgi:hypothetical protein
MDQPNVVTKPREPWNKGKLVGQKAPFKLKMERGSEFRSIDAPRFSMECQMGSNIAVLAVDLQFGRLPIPPQASEFRGSGCLVKYAPRYSLI